MFYRIAVAHFFATEDFMVVMVSLQLGVLHWLLHCVMMILGIILILIPVLDLRNFEYLLCVFQFLDQGILLSDYVV
mgnify:CR=1 FL=1